MPRYIIKLTDKESKDYYLEYSSVVDAPVTYGMSLQDFKKYYINSYGQHSIHQLNDRLERVEECGTSCRLDKSVDDTIELNRAGDKETTLTKDQLINKFCLA